VLFYVTAALSASNAHEEEITKMVTTWPVATDLKLVKGIKGMMQMMLTIQSPIIQAVISNSFEGL
jgi:hypothetical protein